MHAINWFEIPTTDLDRAARFYERVLNTKLRRESFGGMDTAVFACDQARGVGGSLMLNPRRKPGADGPVLYLFAPELESSLTRVREAGGEVLMPATDIGEPGFIALLRDTEGNVVGLHRPR